MAKNRFEIRKDAVLLVTSGALAGALAGAVSAAVLLLVQEQDLKPAAAVPAEPAAERVGPGQAPPAAESATGQETAGAALAVMEAAGKEDSLRGSVEHGAAVTAAAGEPEPSAGRDVETPGHLARWEDLRSQLERLQSRIGGIERRLSAVSAVASSRDADQGRARTPEDRRAALRSAGVADDVAEEIVWLQGQEELDRLELRDQALREGWFGTDRYRAELSEISAQGPDLRADLGDDVYDRYLFAAGEDNRILVEGVIAGSVAEEIGLQPGDIIERYDGGRVFTFGELRRATSEGTRGELVDVQIRRADGSVVQSWVPRGPLGVRLDLTRAEPMP